MGDRAHTPGPWTMRRRDCAPHGDSDNLGWDWDGPEENIPPEPMRGLVSKEADARLIAAAPDMFEALRNAAGLLDTPLARRRHLGDEFYADVVASIRLALEKAAPSESPGSNLADANPNTSPLHGESGR